MIELSRGFSYVVYQRDNGPPRFTLPFEYLKQAHVHAFTGGTEDTVKPVRIQWVSPTVVELPADSGNITVLRRFTPLADLEVNFRNGANLPAKDLRTAMLQLLYAQQESHDAAGGQGGSMSKPPGNPGQASVNHLIDQVLASPALQDLLTRIPLIDMNAGALAEEILRSHQQHNISRDYFEVKQDFFEVKRDYGDKLSSASSKIELLEEENRTTASKVTELFARIRTASTDAAARYSELIEAIASETQARTAKHEELHAQFTAANRQTSAALSQRIDQVEADAESARASTEQRLGVQLNEARAQQEQTLQAEATKLHASIRQQDSKLVAYQGQVTQQLQTIEAAADESQASIRALQQTIAQTEDTIAGVRQQHEQTADQLQASINSVDTRLTQVRDNIASTLRQHRQTADGLSASISTLESGLVQAQGSIAGIQRQQQLSAAEAATAASERQTLSARLDSVPNEIDARISPVAAGFEQRLNTEASRREALAGRVDTLSVNTFPVYFGEQPPQAPGGGFKVGSFWVYTPASGRYQTRTWNGHAWVDVDIAENTPTGALIRNLRQTRITAQQAEAIASTQLQAFKDGQFAAIRQEFNVVAGQHAGMYQQWQAGWSIKINAGTINGAPVVAGIALSANPETGSDFIITADRFAVVHPQYTQGGHLAQVKVPFIVGHINGQTTVGINGQLVVDGSVTADKITCQSLSALSANMGEVNGGTFRTHTLDSAGNIADPTEFRAEISNQGQWPIWVGAGVKNQNNAVFWVDRQGNAGFSGVVNGAYITGSALSLESLRIRCGHGCYAPFTICDTASDFSMSTAGTRIMSATCSGFISPHSGIGYNHKRFARHRMDVQMHVNLHTDHGWEDIRLEVQYDGGSWQLITGTSIDGNYRNSATYLVRYTTTDAWQTVAFRARTIRGLTTCLTLRVDIANYNQSGNPPGSNSDIFAPGGTGGAAPIASPPPPERPDPDEHIQLP
ncbi:MAG: phage tail fiber protein [Pseudomonadota bacterium]|nr:phage tail fiber protein [Pseudomonadota bacterium]